MAVPDHSIDERLLKSAKEVFLKDGFLNASLTEICNKASITTGALYKRYKGKEDLFSMIVKPCVTDLVGKVEEKKEKDLPNIDDVTLVDAWKMDEEYMLWWFNIMYKWHDEVVLLLSCSNGTTFENFQHDFVEKMTITSFEYYKEAYKRKLCEEVISFSEMHILLSSFWTTIYEPLIHGYSFEEIRSYTQLICRLFNWNKTLKMK